MPIQPTYPGVYVEEIPSGVRTITGVATSIAAFIGRAKKGPVDKAVSIFNFGDYERYFGGLWEKSPMSFAVRDFYLNGGGEAIIVRVHKDADTSTVNLPVAVGDNLVLDASSPGSWGNSLSVNIDHNTKDPADTTLFNLTVKDANENKEVYYNMTMVSTSADYLVTVLEQNSSMIRVNPTDIATSRPNVTNPFTPLEEGDDGIHITDEEIHNGAGMQENKRGLYALEDADIFNLLCIPPYVDANFAVIADVDVNAKATDVTLELLAAAAAYCKKRRAMLIVDPRSTWKSRADANSQFSDSTYPGINSNYATMFFPRLIQADPLKKNLLDEFVPCGAMAGIFARTDAQRGVWKAPAGIEATIKGIRGFTVPLTDDENGNLNKIGINCLRAFPVYGRVVWGARTLEGADQIGSEWKYTPVRRTALFIEESLFRGLKWVVFEPNAEPLWGQIRLNVGAFMNSLFRQGAFKGKKKEAYFVKCDSETTTQNDINQGIVNILVGFAPLKPAEFVIIKLQQIAGQIET